MYLRGSCRLGLTVQEIGFAGRFDLENLTCRIGRERTPVRAVRNKRVVDIHDADDLREQRHVAPANIAGWPLNISGLAFKPEERNNYTNVPSQRQR